MKLSSLLENLTVGNVAHHLLTAEVTGLSHHSKKIMPGELFIDFKGDLSFCSEAIQNGAIAAVTSCRTRLGEGLIYLENFQQNIVTVINRFFDFPLENLKVIGVTGTSGKTTTSYLIRHLLDSVGFSCGLISTVEVDTKSSVYDATLTTPDLLSCYRYFHEMVQNSCQYCVMEVSSHGLDQGRVDGIDFSGAVFTNLTHEHLDYHKTMDVYKLSKQKLFTSLSDQSFAIVNADDMSSSFMTDNTKAKIYRYSTKTRSDFFASNIGLSGDGSSFVINSGSNSCFFKTSLTGAFNISNSLAAIATGHLLGVSFEMLSNAFKSFKNTPGRLEKVLNNRDVDVFVDFAHKPDALENVLKTLKGFTKKKMITVIGCGGDRDKEKRPIMAQIAEKYSDILILTSDNPRGEDPRAIVHDMLSGVKRNANVFCVLSRKGAIQKALELSEKKDTVLIAGKGHETYQIIKGEKIPFDDRLVAQKILQEIL